MNLGSAVLMMALATVVVAAIAIWLHYLFEGERLPGDLWREWKLSRTGLEDAAGRWTSAPRRSRIVVSLTTIPSRIGYIADTLKSLYDQSLPPARIVLHVPAFSDREKCPYRIPEGLKGLPGLEIRRCKDWGPATKVIPALLDLAGKPDTAVLVVDDDRIYPRWMVERFDQATAASPDDALTLAGWIVPEDLIDRPTTIRSNLFMLPPAPVRCSRLSAPREIDVMLGTMGYLVKPAFFDTDDLTDFSKGPPALRLVDDVRTSALCRVRKMVIPAPSLGFLPKRHYRFYKDTALAHLNRGSGRPEDRNNSIAIRYCAGAWRVGGPRGGRAGTS